jgi:hypothetical protein
MPKPSVIVLLSLMVAAVDGRSALAAAVIVGVNTVDVPNMSAAQQDGLIEQVGQAGVKTVRVVLNDKSTNFIIHAFQHNIGSVVIVYPTYGSTAEPRPADPAVGLTWRQAGLVGASPTGFRAWLNAQLAPLDAAGVHLTAFEVGNEINTAGFNGDFPTRSSGRVLALSDLQNQDDKEAAAIASGYRQYLRILAQVKEVRDASSLNNKTPILSAGLANVGPARPAQPNSRQLAVSIPATIQYLRANGLDKLVDAYAVHVYPSGDPHQTVAMRTTTLEQAPFAECRKGGARPCWLTEWGFTNSDHSCPLHDTVRTDLVKAERSAFETLIGQGRLAATLYYSWAGHIGIKDSSEAIFRCDALTGAGKLALSPLRVKQK